MVVRNMLSQVAGPVTLVPTSTSYFSATVDHLDPTLFEGMHLRPEIRQWILRTIHSILNEESMSSAVPGRLMHSESWSRIWIAGSGISYQWQASRTPADLDLLLGIHYVEFRRANPAYASFTDSEIASMLNQLFYEELKTQIGDFPFGEDEYEVTAYVNRGVSATPDGITAINPYAAYDVTIDEWAVLPQKAGAVLNPAWETHVERDRQYAEDLMNEYSSALQEIRGAQNHAHRTNAETRLQQVMDRASGLYDELHSGRRAAFGPSGAGYADFNNYRWQAGKRNGIIKATRSIRQYLSEAQDRTDFETYGMELPDTDTLLRRSLMHRMVR